MGPIRFRQRAETHSMHSPGVAPSDAHQTLQGGSAATSLRPVAMVGKGAR